MNRIAATLAATVATLAAVLTMAPAQAVDTAHMSTSTVLKIQDGDEAHQVGDFIVLTYGAAGAIAGDKARVVLEWRYVGSPWHKFHGRDVLVGSLHHYLARLGSRRDVELRARTLKAPEHLASVSRVVTINYEPMGRS